MPNYTIINLKHVIDNEKELLEILKEKMKSFSCQKNSDVDDFIRNNISDNMSDFDKIRKFHDYMVNTYEHLTIF